MYHRVGNCRGLALAMLFAQNLIGGARGRGQGTEKWWIKQLSRSWLSVVDFAVRVHGEHIISIDSGRPCVGDEAIRALHSCNDSRLWPRVRGGADGNARDRAPLTTCLSHL